MSTQTPLQPVDAGDADFQQIVIDASHEVPVLVDFWAPWCEPCKVLGPILEKLVEEFQGRFKLVKVNMDESPMLAQALTIRSIPAVKLIMNGEIRDEFMGAYPEPEVRKFLEKHLPAESDEDAVEGLQRYAAGDKAGARQIFQSTLREDPNNIVAQIGMGNLALEEGNVEEAKQRLDAIAEDDLNHLVDKTLPQQALGVLRARIFLFDHCGSQNGAPGDEGTAGEDLDSRFSRACQKALEGAYEEALQEFLDIVREDRSFKDDAGRKAMLAVFDLLPPDSPLTGTFRTRLSSLLFS
jgi:putative thioredoxin